jgi:hypothetical protein
MRKIYAIVAMLALGIMTISSSRAQSVDFGGTTFNNDIVGWNDLYGMSFTSHNYGTARSMAMGNAFTALGADMISASLNPAGIGMYVESDVSISPMMQFTKSPTANAKSFYLEGTPKHKQKYSDHCAPFGLASAGGVATAYKGTGAITNVNIGFVYNRIADFNQTTAFASLGNPGTESLANIFCTLANVDGLKTNNDGTMPFGNDPFYWGTTLAYKNGLINKDDEGWFIDRIDADLAEIDQYSAVETRGSLGEYALTIGLNFRDVVYVGASLGIQSLNYKQTVFYGEDYIYAPGNEPSGEVMPYQLTYMNYEQRTRITGTGFNFKIGVTARPVDWLRIGVAYHTPTYYSLSLRYGGDMWSGTYSAGNNPEDYDIDRNGYMYDNVGTPIWEDAGPNSWNFRSPSRLMVGAAVTLAKRIIVSADYERSWYQSIRLQQSPILGLSYTDSMKTYFKGSNTLRVGAEMYMLPFLPVRVGYIWNGSTLRKGYENMVASHPLPTKQQYITAGFGIKFTRSVYMDFAYQYGITNYTDYQTFYAIDSEDETLNIQSDLFSTKTRRHIAVITFGVRF